MSMRKVYSYVVCLVALLILLWGVVDVISASIGMVVLKPSTNAYEPLPPEGSMIPGGGDIKGIEPSIEDYYQRRMVMDRFGDSFARILVSGIVFAYFSLKLKAEDKE